MSDRVLRDEIFESDRWLDLPSDTHRLAYIGLLPIADDFGNFEGGPRRVYRHLHRFTQIKTDADSIKVMSDLLDADMARRYEVEGREYWHLPRFTTHRQYIVRRCPPSPWDVELGPLGKEQRVYNRGHAKKVATTSQQRSNDVAQGVEVGVEVEKVKNNTRADKPRRTVLPPDFTLSEKTLEWCKARTIPVQELQARYDWFKDYARSSGKQYADWQAAFKNSVRGNWAKLNPGEYGTAKLAI